jgi:signal transduction histidine kinase/ligand-binding sensor domain-containing protein
MWAVPKSTTRRNDSHHINTAVSHFGMKALNALISRSVVALVAIILTTSLSPLTPINVYAESPPFKIYTTEEGLAHDSVNKIVRDSRGFLWFCTSEGLSRFDGKRFTNFTQDQGLPHRNVTSFLETRDGTYLIGTSAGVVVFNPNGRAYRWNMLESRLEQNSDEAPMFRTFSPGVGIRQTNHFHSLWEAADGTIWAGTGWGLFRVLRDADDLRFEEIRVENDSVPGFYAFLDDPEGGVITISSNGIFRITNQGVDLLDRIGAGSILRTTDGRIWIGASGAPTGIRIYEFSNGKLNLVERYTTKDGLLSDLFQTSIIQLPDGRIFVSLESGLQQYLPNAKGDEPKFRTLATDIITALATDSADNVWLGTELKGSWQLLRSGFVSYGEKDGIKESEDIRSLYVSHSGELFIPTRPLAILHLLPNGKFESISPRDLTGRSWGWNHLDFESIDGEWWVPGSDGLRRYPKVPEFKDLERTTPKQIYTRKDGLHGNEAFGTFEDSRGDVWITTDQGGGSDTLARWDRKSDKIVAYSSSDGIPANSGAVSYAEDSHGNVWFGFYFGGVVRYKDGKFQQFAAKDGLPESMASALFADSQGRLWIGTSGRGLFRVDDPNAEKPVFTNISTQNGLSSNQVICITGDQFKQVYVGTGHGINRLDSNGTIEVLTQTDGLPSNYITRCAADKNGYLWFVSRSTLVRYSPEIKFPVAPPPVYIDKVSVNGAAQKISVLGESDITLPELSSGQTQIQISYFALSFGAGENIRYQYRLDDQDWSTPTDQQTINFDVAPDKHNLEIRAARADGVPSEKPAKLGFRILPPIWARWWFVTLSALLIAAMIIALYRYRMANLRAVNVALKEANLAEESLRRSREERLAELEEVRSRIATDLHDDIGASLTQIAILSEVAQTQAKKGNGASVEPLSKITNVSNELISTMSDIVWSINPSKDHVSDLTQRMRRFASDVLSSKDISFQFRAPETDNELKLNTSLRREVFLIFKESVNNIVKHSGAKNVHIEMRLSNEDLILETADDGSGFKTGDTSTKARFSIGGNGILSMKKRAQALGGSLQIRSEHGEGTTIYLRLPIENIHNSVAAVRGS